jgi:asparagine synthase (glutamine-hydrolysing)
VILEDDEMCGIAGATALRGTLDPDIASALPAMTAALQHRGPDGDGFFTDPFVGLGHRRLSIIDRAGGRQPLSNEDGSVWITFNGEIYNHHELRDRLEAKGHQFRTRSDTEAIVHAYEEFGVNCVDHLEGMFAFAIYDQRRREVLIARDRLGKKPLFYGVLGGALHFASEIKALMVSPAWNSAVDLDQLETYLSLGYILAPASIYRHVHKLEPGHWLRLRDGHIEIREYWNVLEVDNFDGSEADAVRLIEEQLHDRVVERLESEVPLGAFLSGGIDSGLVVSAMAQAHRGSVITTSVGFGEAGHNELEPAGLTATSFRTEHHPSVVEPRLEEILDGLVAAFDEPFADSSSVPTWYVSREARRHVTVALSGDGGDETFGGYHFRYVPHAVESAIRSGLPGRSLKRAVGQLGAAWPRSSRLPKPLRLATFLENVGRDPEAAYYADLCCLKQPATQALLGRAPSRDLRATAAYEAVTGAYRRCPSTSAVQRAEYADLKIYLPNDVLVKVDRMSMQHSLEVRCPLLDRRLVELAFRLPQSLKRAGRTGKHLLKQVARRRLPAEVMSYPKHGFTAPVGSWIAGPYRERFRAEVLSADSHIASMIDARVARQWFDAHVTCQADHSFGLWALWMLERWSRAQRPATPAATNDRTFKSPMTVSALG